VFCDNYHVHLTVLTVSSFRNKSSNPILESRYFLYPTLFNQEVFIMRQLRMYLTAFLLLCSSALPTLYAQAPPSITGGLLVDPQGMTLGSVSALILGSSSNSGQTVLSITITNPNQQEVRIGLKAVMFRNGTELGNGITINRNIPLPPGRPLTLTNLTFGSGIWKMDGSSNKDEVRSLLSTSGGRFPAGSYYIEWSVLGPDGNLFPGSTPFIMPFNVVGQREAFVKLIAPGGLLDPSAPVQEVYTLFPTFQWQGEADNYQLQIFEDAEEKSNFNSVQSSVIPHVDVRLTTASYQYPTSGARPLVPGRLYFWRVRGTLVGGGTAEEIFSFRMSKNASANATASSNSPASMEELKILLKTKYKVRDAWLDEANFISFTGLIEGMNFESSVDVNTLIQALSKASKQQ
jgi:hypothetical protein